MRAVAGSSGLAEGSILSVLIAGVYRIGCLPCNFKFKTSSDLSARSGSNLERHRKDKECMKARYFIAIGFLFVGLGFSQNRTEPKSGGGDKRTAEAIAVKTAARAAGFGTISVIRESGQRGGEALLMQGLSTAAKNALNPLGAFLSISTTPSRTADRILDEQQAPSKEALKKFEMMFEPVRAQPQRHDGPHDSGGGADHGGGNRFGDSHDGPAGRALMDRVGRTG